MAIVTSNAAPEIVMQNLQMQIPLGKQTFTEELLVGEIADIKIEHKAYVGSTKQIIELPKGQGTMFLFVSGTGILSADSMTHNITPESMAVPINNIRHVQLEIGEGEILHFLQFTKKMSPQDIEDLKHFPEENKYNLFFTRFEDCEPYTEKIKSPNTISRTVYCFGRICL